MKKSILLVLMSTSLLQAAAYVTDAVAGVYAATPARVTILNGSLQTIAIDVVYQNEPSGLVYAHDKFDLEIRDLRRTEASRCSINSIVASEKSSGWGAYFFGGKSTTIVFDDIISEQFPGKNLLIEITDANGNLAYTVEEGVSLASMAEGAASLVGWCASWFAEAEPEKAEPEHGESSKPESSK